MTVTAVTRRCWSQFEMAQGRALNDGQVGSTNKRGDLCRPAAFGGSHYVGGDGVKASCFSALVLQLRRALTGFRYPSGASHPTNDGEHQELILAGYGERLELMRPWMGMEMEPIFGEGQHWNGETKQMETRYDVFQKKYKTFHRNDETYLTTAQFRTYLRLAETPDGWASPDDPKHRHQVAFVNYMGGLGLAFAGRESPSGGAVLWDISTETFGVESADKFRDAAYRLFQRNSLRQAMARDGGFGVLTTGAGKTMSTYLTVDVVGATGRYPGHLVVVDAFFTDTHTGDVISVSGDGCVLTETSRVWLQYHGRNIDMVVFTRGVLGQGCRGCVREHDPAAPTPGFDVSDFVEMWTALMNGDVDVDHTGSRIVIPPRGGSRDAPAAGVDRKPFVGERPPRTAARPQRAKAAGSGAAAPPPTPRPAGACAAAPPRPSTSAQLSWTKEEEDELMLQAAAQNNQWSKIARTSEIFRRNGRTAGALKKKHQTLVQLNSAAPQTSPGASAPPQSAAARLPEGPSVPPEPSADQAPRARRPFDETEEAEIRAGVQKHGNQWAVILRESPTAASKGRTSADLKNKWRIMSAHAARRRSMEGAVLVTPGTGIPKEMELARVSDVTCPSRRAVGA